MYSIGFSIVIMCFWCFWLISPISEARVVDFPCPVGPVTRTRPCGRSISFIICSGMPRLSNVGISAGITRKTPPSPCLW